MTIKIEIEAHPDRGDMSDQIKRAMSALGYVREDMVAQALSDPENQPSQWGTVPAGTTVVLVDPLNRAEQQTVTEPTTQVVATRKRGEPSPGRSRRTKAEIAEDEAAEKAEIANRIAGRLADAPVEEIDAAIETFAAISTGENRVGPDDTDEDAVQDAADEQAEMAAKREPGKLTHDDLRKAVGDYQKKHGMPAAVALVQAGGLIGKPIIEVPEADLEAVIAAVSGVAVAAVSKPVEQASDKPAETQAAPVTKDDLLALMQAYVKKYGDVAAAEDGQKIFVHALGEVPPGTKTAKGQITEKWVFSAIPNDQDSLSKCVKWWKSALTQAPEAFGRKAVA